MKTNKHLLWLAAIFLLVIGFTVYLKFSHSNVKAVTNTVIEPTAFDCIEKVTETIEKKNYIIRSIYPKFESEEINLQINEYINQQKNNFLTIVKDKNSSTKPTLTIDFEIVTGLSDIKNIIITTTSFIDKEFTTKKIMTVDETLQQPLSLKEIVMLDYLTKPVLVKLITDHVSIEQLPMETLKNEINDRSIFDLSYVTEDELVICINVNGEYDTINLPLSSLVFSLKEPYQTIVQEKIKIEEEVTEDVAKKKVAITFDDGPNPKNTKKVLETLNKYDAKATFFMIGKEVERHPDIAKEVAAAGHEIGNHSWFHENLTKLTISDALDNLHRTNEKIFEATGVYPTIYRPPYGAINESLNLAIPMEKVMWTIDTQDWKYKNLNHLMNEIQTNLQDGSIILLHDIHESTANALDTIVNYIVTQGYECVTISELGK